MPRFPNAVVAVIAVVVLGGCPKLPVPTAGPVKDPVAIAPAAEIVARPGEQMSYRITIHRMEVAAMQISVGEPTVFDGHAALVVQVRAQSQKLLSWVHPIDDTLTSWIDRGTGRPLAFQVSELASREDGDVEASEMRFAPGTFTVHRERHGQTFEEPQVVNGEAYDIPSMLTFFRGWEGEPGTQVKVDVMRARGAWRTQVAIAAVETLPTALGDQPTVRYDGEAVRLLRDGTIDPKSPRRQFSIWITDDADRVPARLVARTDYGDVEVDLVAYQAP